MRTLSHKFGVLFRPLAPKQPRYALGAKPGDAKLAPGWKILLPSSLTERRFEGT